MTLRLGLARGGPDPLTDSLLEAIAESAASIDVRCEWLRPDDHDADQDVVLVVGAPRSYEWFFDAPQKTSRISWFGEPLPRPITSHRLTPDRLEPGLSHVARRTILTAARYLAGPLTRRPLPGRLGEWREAAAIDHERVDNLAMAAWCRDRGARIVVTSQDRVAALALAGIPATVVPFGYHPRHAGPMTPPDTTRDIAVVVVGTGLNRTRLRRGRILARLRPELRQLGEIVEIDGRWGGDRDAVLRRARVIVDIQRVPGNFTGLRWLLASAAGCAYVGEPMDDPAPFRVGVDLVQAPADTLIQAIAALLKDESYRRSIVERAQTRLDGDLAMERSLARVLFGSSGEKGAAAIIAPPKAS